MQFTNPLMFLTLAFIPILILIHALKSKPRQIEVTNLFLWQEVLKERTSHLTLTKLKKNLPLLLQILMVCLAALALANPMQFSFTHQKGNMILVVDTSASMQTRIESPDFMTRSDLAKDKAREIIEGRKGDQKILIIEAGREPMVKSGFLEDIGQAKQLIKNLKPSDVSGNLKKAVHTAISFVGSHQEDDIYLITDGAGADFSAIVNIHPRISPVLITGGGKNIGITKFEFRKQFDRNDRYEVLLEIKNFTSRQQEVPVRLSIDRAKVYDKRHRLKAHEKRLLILPYSGIISGVAKAFLDIDDDFLVDNRAFLSLSSARDIWVLLVSEGNYFIEKLLESYPNIMVNTIREIDPSFWNEQVLRHDIVIVDRMDFPPIQRGNFLLIDSYSSSIPVKKEGSIDFPKILDWDLRHPVMSDVDAGDLFIEQASRIKTDLHIEPIMESSQTGLVYAFEFEGIRAITIGFDITRSDLPIKIAYPVLMSNIINWLNPHKLALSSMHTRTGNPIKLYLQPQTGTLSVRGPRQEWEEFTVESNPFVYTNTKKVGIYTYIENNKRRYFTANLLDEMESDIRTPESDSLSKAANIERESEPIEVGRSLWAVFIGLAFAVLVLEWMVWLKVG